MSNFRPIDRSGFLLPPWVQEWLPQRHLARFVVEVVEGLGPLGAGAVLPWLRLRPAAMALRTASSSLTALVRSRQCGAGPAEAAISTRS